MMREVMERRFRALAAEDFAHRGTEAQSDDDGAAGTPTSNSSTSGVAENAQTASPPEQPLRVSAPLRASKKNGHETVWPDLVLIDGGKGQMSSVRDTLEEMGIEDVPLIAIAKGPHHGREGREVFHFPDGREKTLPGIVTSRL